MNDTIFDGMVGGTKISGIGKNISENWANDVLN